MMTKEMYRLMVLSGADRGAPDHLTVTLHGPKTEDRARLVRVLTHLLGSSAEWDGPLPNVSFVVTDDA